MTDHWTARSEPLLDAEERVSGRKLYVDDLRLPDTLVARFLRSPNAHARIVSIDVSRALATPGVKSVITGLDAPRRYGVLPVGHDETALAVDKVRYAGQEVACVAAETEEIAEDALRKIVIQYELLTAHLSAHSAMAATHHLVHDDKPGNIEKEYHHSFGDSVRGLAEADVVVADTFYHPRVSQAATEPHGTLARFDGADHWTIWTSTQTPRHVQRGVALALDVPAESIRVIPCAVGGGFGGKSETFPQDVSAALLSRITGAPVRIRLSREEVFTLHRGRPENYVRMRLGLRRDGKVTAVECEVIQDGGAFCGYGVATILYSGALLGAIYDIDNIRYDGYRVLTNKPACGPMRGHGTIATRHAFEALLDQAAVALDLDPLDVRRANLLKPNSRTVNDLRVTSYGYPECLERVAEASSWKARRGRMPRGRGLGMAGSHYVSGAANSIVRGSSPHSTVVIEIDPSGRVTLLTGAAEIGQGSDTVLALVAARRLGLEASAIRVISGDTALTPPDLGSYSSRVTFMTGNAALEAATRLAARLKQAAGKRLGLPPDALVLAGGAVRSAPGGPMLLAFQDAVRMAAGGEGQLIEKGSYLPPGEAQGGRFPGSGVGPGVAYSYSAQVVEVQVNEETGEVRVERVWAAHDCGKALNPQAVMGQVEGSVWMGLGQALSEELHYSPQGLLLNGGLLEYRIPGAVESPPVEVFIVESHDPEGPFGAKEAGEGSVAAVIPALTNAIHDAIGVWITELPITPERVLAAIQRQGHGSGAKPALPRPRRRENASARP